VEKAGDITLLPTISTCPIPWSMLTELAPVIFHISVDVPPGLIVDGKLLKSPITRGVPNGCVVADG